MFEFREKRCGWNIFLQFCLYFAFSMPLNKIVELPAYIYYMLLVKKFNNHGTFQAQRRHLQVSRLYLNQSRSER